MVSGELYGDQVSYSISHSLVQIKSSLYHHYINICHYDCSASQQSKTVSSLTFNRMEPSNISNIDVDVVIVGAGLTGLGVARHLTQHQASIIKIRKNK